MTASAAPRPSDPGIIHGKYFQVQIDGQDFGFFTQVSGISSQIETMDYAEGGVNDRVHRLPGRVKQGNVTLKHGVVMKETMLYQWYAKALGAVKPSELIIYVHDSYGTPVQTWTFKSAYPVKWTASDLNAGGTEFLTQTLEIAHSGMTIEGK